jgi:hypothetical protein
MRRPPKFVVFEDDTALQLRRLGKPVTLQVVRCARNVE